MAYLIDGHNLIPKIPGLNLNQMEDEMVLIKLLQDFCQNRKKNVEVYFDGAPPGQARNQRFGMVSAYFIRKGMKADTAIIQRLQKLSREAPNWIVVTSDRQIQAEARSLKAHVLSSEDFANELITAAQRGQKGGGGNSRPLSEGEVQEWLRIFGEKKAKNS
jgi:uncharacterized protein